MANNIFPASDTEKLRKYSHYLYRDIEALDSLLSEERFEKGVTRIGAEQELCLLDKFYRPAPIADEIMAGANDERINNELARYNLEINLTPQELKSDCFQKMSAELLNCLSLVENELKKSDSKYILTGILPTIRPADIGVDNMTPKNRYYALNESILKLRGGSQNVRIEGLDELITTNNSVMFESCNTSFQVHYQTSVDDFCDHYNWSQAIAGPVLAATCNSPLFLGKRLWMETRIALFRQAAEVRSNNEDFRERRARVFFGHNWCNGILDSLRDNLSRHRPLVVSDSEEDSLALVKDGITPKLKALTIYNSTIYQWNRACYGTLNNIPHLRIENRYLPSGPSVTDEVANTVFWAGLMNGLPDKYRKISEKIDFDIVKSNFISAAKLGLKARLYWLDGQEYAPEELIVDQLLPIAENGLKKAKVDENDILANLQIIKNRVLTGKNGAQWMLDSFNTLKATTSIDQSSLALTAAIVKRQNKKTPVHQWPYPKKEDAGDGVNRFQRVEQIMSRDLFTMNEEDLIDIAPNLMVWKKVRYILIENESGELAGLVTIGHLGRHYSLRKKEDQQMPPIKTIMTTDLVTVPPDKLTIEAIDLMEENNIGCLPVVDGKKLVGVLTEKDFLPISKFYLKRG